MECNRDEADRAKQIAEKKFVEKDLLGARKFALKAQQLFPGLEGILHILPILDVHVAAENKICGQPDWYGILGVTPTADEETVRKQYRKLALVLHPDKNKAVGADAAFKLISEALSLLSDKNKRLAYDQKRNTKVKASTVNGGCSSTEKKENGMQKSARPATNSTAPRSNTQGTPSAPSTPSTPSTPSAPRTPATFDTSKSNTFWTLCRACMMQYEYFRIYLNHKIICPSCRQPYLAAEVPRPILYSSSPPKSWNFPNKKKNSDHYISSESKSNARKTNMANEHVECGRFGSTGLYQQNSSQQHPFPRTSGTTASTQAANMVQQAHEKLKRTREEAQEAAVGDTFQKKQHVPTNPVVPNRQ